MAETWYKLDNVAKVFIATNTRRDPRVFRISCTLNEQVVPEVLETALEKTVRRFPNFQVTLHRGLFWHYLETTKQRPAVEPEQCAPCAEIYADGRNDLLYRVSYYGARINVEMFHVLADGNGGFAFLKTLVCYYLKEQHPAELAEAVPETDGSAADLAQNSFRRFYGKRRAPESHPAKAYRLHGMQLPYDQLQYFEAHLSAGEALAAARACGTTLTGWLAARLGAAVWREALPLERSRPIVVSLPVNLRNYYPSATARNFFNTVKVGHVYTGEESVAEVATAIDAALKEQLSSERIMAQMDSFEHLEHNVLIKPVPLVIKNWVVNFFNWLESGSETLTISNMGRVKMGAGLDPYVKGISAFSSTQTIFMCVCSYGDDLTLGISSAYRSTNILRNFFRGLAEDGLAVTLDATEVETR